MGVSNKYIKRTKNGAAAVLVMFFKDLLCLQQEHLSVWAISMGQTKTGGFGKHIKENSILFHKHKSKNIFLFC